MQTQFVDGNPSLDRPKPYSESRWALGIESANTETLSSMQAGRAATYANVGARGVHGWGAWVEYMGGVHGWDEELTFQPSGPRREPKMSQATTVPAMDPTAPMMKAPKVLLAALRSLQYDHSAGSRWGEIRVG